jgi:hypothetical protein
MGTKLDSFRNSAVVKYVTVNMLRGYLFYGAFIHSCLHTRVVQKDHMVVLF